MGTLTFKESAVDPSLFIYRRNSITIFLFIYVDDIVIVGSKEEEVRKVIGRLGDEFPIRDLGIMEYFLGIQVKRVRDGLHLSQTRYLFNLLRSCNMGELKAVSTPMLANAELHLDGHQRPCEFRRIIGSLQYITLTRPDVQVAVNWLAQFIAEPKMIHWLAVKRVLCYFFRTQKHGIALRQVKDFSVTAYCDADWEGDTVDRKSRTGFLVYVGGTLVSWVSKKQST